MADKKGKITAKSLVELIEKQNFRCALSGVELTPDTASIDHKIPISRGGLNDISNLWILEANINRAKNTMTVEEFIQMCRDVTEFHRSSSLPPCVKVC